MSGEKSGVLFFPRNPVQRRTQQIECEKNQKRCHPTGPVNNDLGDVRSVIGFNEGADRERDRQKHKQNDSHAKR